MVIDRVNSGLISALVAARYWGYLTTAMYDATIAVWDSKYTTIGSSCVRAYPHLLFCE
jgi:hypothetical protein